MTAVSDPNLKNDPAASDFKRLVEQDVRQADRRQREHDAGSLFIRRPENAERWHLELVAMKKGIESQLAARSEECKAIRLELEIEMRAVKLKILQARRASDDGDAAAARRRAKNILGYEEQLTELLQTYDQTLIDHLRWRSTGLRFRAAVEDRLTEANRVRQPLLEEREAGQQRYHDLAHRLVAALEDRNRMASAIRTHRQEMELEYEEGDDNASDADVELWKLLDEVEPH